jgi:GMP synthase-like glutamine amidotransferase
MMASGGDALDISKLVEESLMNDTNVGGGTISSLSTILADLIVLRGSQQGDNSAADNVEQTVEFVDALLQSLDTLVGACDGWQDIFNASVRYQTATAYLK